MKEWEIRELDREFNRLEDKRTEARRKIEEFRKKCEEEMKEDKK